jgi:hypothetical protein
MRRNRELSISNLSEEKIVLEEDELFLSPDGEVFLRPSPASSRSCTDIFWIFLLCACWLAMTVIGLQATGVASMKDHSSVLFVPQGDPNRLFRGIDYEGNLCGIGGLVTSLENRWEPTSGAAGNCVSSNGLNTPTEFAVCVSTCPQKGSVIADPYGQYGTWTAIEDVSSCNQYTIYTNSTHS